MSPQAPDVRTPTAARIEKIFSLMLAPQDAYSEDAEAFVAFLKTYRLSLSYEALRRYVEFLDLPHEGKRYSAATFNKRLSGAKKRIRYVFEKSPDALDAAKRYRLEKALNEIKPKRINTRAVGREKILTLEEIDELISGLAEKPFPGAKNVGLIVEFLAHTGVRIAEALGVLTSDIVKNGSSYHLRILGKGNKERTVFVDNELMQRIREAFGGVTYLFEHALGKPYNKRYVTNQIALAGKMILAKEISAHTFRHSWATHTLKKTKNLKGVSKYLGHTSTSTTADLYVHDELTPDDVM